MNKTFQILLSQVTAWAKLRPDIFGVLLAGSHASGSASVDSDVDLIILCDSPETYVNDRSWARNFGEVKEERIEDWGKLTSVRVYYENGLEIEFGFSDAAWAAQPLDAGTREVLRDGFQILFDRGNALGGLETNA